MTIRDEWIVTGGYKMALKMFLDSLDGLDEVAKGHYIESDGKFKLDVSGGEDVSGLKSALDKERKANKTSSKALAEMQAKFKDIDPEIVRELMAKANSEKEQELLKSGDIDKLVEARLEPYRRKSEEEKEQLSLTNKSLSKKVITRAFTSISKGLHEDAIGDMIILGTSEFTLDENAEPVKLGSDGKPVLGKDGKSNLSPAEWLEDRRQDKKHWFLAGDSGGDSTGTGGKAQTKHITDPVQRINASRGVKD
jgi:hypothetical protein